MRRHTEYENMVAAYHLLSPTERRELDAHVGECSLCAADLAAYRRMDAELRGLQGYRASAAMRANVSEALSGAPAAPAPKMPRPKLQEPVIRQQKPARSAWTWERALAPLGFIVIFALAIGLSLPRVGGRNGAEVIGQPVAAPQNQAEIVKLKFSCDAASAFGNDGLWWKVIAAFEEANPDIEVDINAPITGTDADSYHQAIADMAERDDVFCAVPLASDWQRGVVANLGPYIANDPEFNPDDFYPALWRPSEHGEVLSVPTYFRPMLMKYNPQLFDRAGVPYPGPGWTWDDFLAAAKGLTVREGGEVTQWGYYESVAGMFSVRLRSDLGADLKSLPDYATAANTLGWFERLYVDEPAAPNVSIHRAMGGKVYMQPFVNMLNDGKIAMTNIDMQSDREGPRHLAPYPDASYGFLSSYFSDLVMSRKTAHPDEAWRLLSYLSRHLPDGEVPARRSLAEQASFWQGLDESSAAAYRYALDHLAAPVLSTPLPDGFKEYQDAAIAVALGEKSAEQALADLDAQVKLRGGPTERQAVEQG